MAPLPFVVSVFWLNVSGKECVLRGHSQRCLLVHAWAGAGARTGVDDESCELLVGSGFRSFAAQGGLSCSRCLAHGQISLGEEKTHHRIGFIQDEH